MTVNVGDVAVERATVEGLRRSLGAHLAVYRRAAGVSQPELGRAIGRTRSMVSRVEHGTRAMPEALWKIIDEVCRAEGALVAEHHMLADAERDYRARYRTHRRQARQGVAQAQVDALHASPPSLLGGGGSGGDVWSKMAGVDGELAKELMAVVTKLVQSVGRREAMRLVGCVLAAVGLSGLDADECTRVVQAWEAPRRVDAQVVENLSVTLAQCKRLEDKLGPREVLDTVVAQHGLARRLLVGCPEQWRKPLIVVDSSIASAIGGYLINMGHPQEATRYFQRARKAGHDAGNPVCAAYAAANASLAAFVRRDTCAAVDMAAVARSLAARTDDMRLKALAEQMAAAAYALDGQYGPCMAASARAHDMLTHATVGAADSPAYYMHHGTVDSQRSLFLCLLGKPKQALEAASSASARFDRTYVGSYAHSLRTAPHQRHVWGLPPRWAGEAG